jgi:prepilin-type N-terminal cleavage/methylation domain-containing protein
VSTVINSSPISTQRVKSGFTLVELLVAVSVLGILTSVSSMSFQSIHGFYEQRRLRNAALEAMDMIRERRALVMARGAADCIRLNPDDINRRLVSEVRNLDVNPKTQGNAQVCFTNEGFVRDQMTLLLSSPAAASHGDWCVVVTPLLAQTHLGLRPKGQPKCSFVGSGGSL